MYISSVSCSIVLFNRSYLLRIIVCCYKSWLGWLWFLVCVAVQTDEDIARLSAVIAESKPVARKLAQRVQQLLTVSWLSVSNTCVNIFVIMCVVLFVCQRYLTVLSSHVCRRSQFTSALTTSLLWLLFMQPARASLPSYCDSPMLLIPY